MSSSMSDRYDTVLEKNLYTNRKNKTENEKKKKNTVVYLSTSHL